MDKETMDRETIKKIVTKSSNCKKLYDVIENSEWDIGRYSAIIALTDLAKKGKKRAVKTLIYASQNAPYAIDRCNAAYAVLKYTTGNDDLAQEAMAKSILEALKFSDKEDSENWLKVADENTIQEVIKNVGAGNELRDRLFCERLTDMQAIREAAGNKELHRSARYKLIRSKLPKSEWVDYVASLYSTKWSSFDYHKELCWGVAYYLEDEDDAELTRKTFLKLVKSPAEMDIIWDKLYSHFLSSRYNIIQVKPQLAKELLLEAESLPNKIWKDYSKEAAPADYLIMAEQAKAPLVKAIAAVSVLKQCPGRYGEKLYDSLKIALGYSYDDAFKDIKEVITAEAEAGGFTREQCIDFINLLADDLEKYDSWNFRRKNSCLLKRLYKCLSSENDEEIEKLFTQIKNKSYSKTHSDYACYTSLDDDFHKYDEFTFDPSE